MTAKRRSENDNAMYKQIHSFESKALDALEGLPVFTFDKFEDIYLQNRDAAEGVMSGS